jgi:hypothetical protein
MQTLRPHIFFDDQRTHLEGTAKYVRRSMCRSAH